MQSKSVKVDRMNGKLLNLFATHFSLGALMLATSSLFPSFGEESLAQIVADSKTADVSDETVMTLIEMADYYDRAAAWELVSNPTFRQHLSPPQILRMQRIATGPATGEAQFELGMKFWRAQGVAQDSSAAAYWFARATENGHESAALMLSHIQESGDGLEQDKLGAMRTLETLARRGSAEAQYRLGVRQGADGKSWVLRAAEAGNVNAQRYMGIQLAAGGLFETDEVAAFDWLERAANQGDAEAQMFTGLFLLHGRGTSVDKDTAYYWLKSAQIGGELRAAPFVESLEEDVSLTQKFNSMNDALDRGRPSPVDAQAARWQWPSQERLGYGTAFWVDPRGYALAPAHVVEFCSAFRDEHGNEFQIVAREPANDIVLLKADTRVQSWLAPGNQSAEVGDDLAVLIPKLNVADADGVIQNSALKAKRRSSGDGRFLRTDAWLEQGNSGSPVIDTEGRLQGMIIAKMTANGAFKESGVAGEPVALAVKSAVIDTFLNVNGIVLHSASAGEPIESVFKLDCWY